MLYREISESVQKDGTIDVTYISKDADMKEGEELITSHISSKYLEGNQNRNSKQDFHRLLQFYKVC